MRKAAYGVSRSRDEKGVIVGTHLVEYTMCLHASLAGGHPSMWVLVAEEYDTVESDT